MSELLEKQSVLQAIDIEISSANEQRRLEGLNSWVISVAAVALVGIGASLWEADHLQWSSVAAYFIALTLTAEVAATVLVSDEPQSAPLSRSPFRLWVYPRAMAALQQLLLVLLAVYLRAWVPRWAGILAVANFSVNFLATILMDPGIVRVLSGLRAVQRNLSGYEQAIPRIHSSVRAYRFAKWSAIAIHSMIVVACIRITPVLRQGSTSLRDVRFAAVSFLLMVLIGLAISQRSSFIAGELKLLRHDLSFDRVSPPDAAAILFALVAGVHYARVVFIGCVESITEVAGCRAEADGALARCITENKSSNSLAAVRHLLQRFISVDGKVRRLLVIATATDIASEVLSPLQMQVLTTKIAELRSEHEVFGTRKVDLQVMLGSRREGA